MDSYIDFEDGELASSSGTPNVGLSTSRPSSPSSSSSTQSSLDVTSHQHPGVREASSLPLLTPEAQASTTAVSNANVDANVNAKPKSSFHSFNQRVPTTSQFATPLASSLNTPLTITPVSLTPQSSRKQLRPRARRIGGSSVQIPANVEIHADSPLRVHLPNAGSNSRNKGPSRPGSGSGSAVNSRRPSTSTSSVLGSLHSSEDGAWFDAPEEASSRGSGTIGSRASNSSLSSTRSAVHLNTSSSPPKTIQSSGSIGYAQYSSRTSASGSAKGKQVHPIFPAGAHHDKDWEKGIQTKEHEDDLLRMRERELAVQKEREQLLIMRKRVKEERVGRQTKTTMKEKASGERLGRSTSTTFSSSPASSVSPSPRIVSTPMLVTNSQSASSSSTAPEPSTSATSASSSSLLMTPSTSNSTSFSSSGPSLAPTSPSTEGAPHGDWWHDSGATIRIKTNLDAGHQHNQLLTVPSSPMPSISPSLTSHESIAVDSPDQVSLPRRKVSTVAKIVRLLGGNGGHGTSGTTSCSASVHSMASSSITSSSTSSLNKSLSSLKTAENSCAYGTFAAGKKTKKMERARAMTVKPAVRPCLANDVGSSSLGLHLPSSQSPATLARGPSIAGGRKVSLLNLKAAFSSSSVPAPTRHHTANDALAPVGPLHPLPVRATTVPQANHHEDPPASPTSSLPHSVASEPHLALSPSEPAYTCGKEAGADEGEATEKKEKEKSKWFLSWRPNAAGASTRKGKNRERGRGMTVSLTTSIPSSEIDEDVNASLSLHSMPFATSSAFSSIDEAKQAASVDRDLSSSLLNSSAAVPVAPIRGRARFLKQSSTGGEKLRGRSASVSVDLHRHFGLSTMAPPLSSPVTNASTSGSSAYQNQLRSLELRKACNSKNDNHDGLDLTFADRLSVDSESFSMSHPAFANLPRAEVMAGEWCAPRAASGVDGFYSRHDWHEDEDI